MKTIVFDCQSCGYHNMKLPLSGWTDGANYVIVSCPQCEEQQPTVEYEECDW